MKKLKGLAACLITIFMLSVISTGGLLSDVSAQLTVTDGNVCQDEGGMVIGARYKSFANTGSREVYLGYADLGDGTNRVEKDVSWVKPGNHPITLTWDVDPSSPFDHKLKTEVEQNGGGSNLASLEKEIFGAGKVAGTCWNALFIMIMLRDEGATLNLNDVKVNGESIGSFQGVFASGYCDAKFWIVTDIDFTDDVTVIGTIEVDGTFSGDETSKIELHFGCTECGECPECPQSPTCDEPCQIDEAGLDYVVVGADFNPKPVGVGAADPIDWSSATIILGMLAEGNLHFDTDSNVVEQSTGQPTAAGDDGPIFGREDFYAMSGGPFVVATTFFYNENWEAQNAPLHFGTYTEGATTFNAFYDRDGEIIPGSSIDSSLVGSSVDIFMIQVFTDANGNKVLMAYGYAGKGTFASALYFKEQYFPEDLDCRLRSGSWVIVEWRDLNGNGLPEILYDSFNEVAMGP